jgi:serine/threonine-protein kinase
VEVTPTGRLCPRCGKPEHGSAAFDCPANKTPAPHSLIAPGLQVGEYRVEEKIGAGGMGVVYRAAHIGTGKPAAIKVLSGVHARDTNAIRRFILEIRAVNQIRHANLVEIYSFGQLTDGRYYYVMEYLEGCSLGAIMRSRGRLLPQELFPIFIDVLKALATAHDKGVVHRDLKPDNVFLVTSKGGTRTRAAKLLDFGLAKLIERADGSSAPLTAAGMAVGTPQYMAPEQCKAHKVDARTDLYALGVMMYEAITGQLPCDGRNTLEIWESHVKRVPRRPAELVPEITAETDSIVMTLLAKAPDERFSSAAAVVNALAHESERGPALALDLSEVISAGASASDVARAIPSEINSAALVALDEEASPPAPPPVATQRSVEAQGLREVLDEGLEVAEPAAETTDPAQVSAFDVDLGGLPQEPPPAWASQPSAASSGRLKAVTTTGHSRAVTARRASGGSWKLLLLFGLAVVAAAAMVLTR